MHLGSKLFFSCIFSLLCLQQTAFCVETSKNIAFIGVWDRAKPVIERESRKCGVAVSFLQQDDPLQNVGLALVLNLRGLNSNTLAQHIREAQTRNPQLAVLALDQRGSQTALRTAELLRDDPQILAYWDANGAENIQRLLIYADTTYLGGNRKIQEPVVIPNSGYYHPALKQLSDDLSVAESASSPAKTEQSDNPRAIILIQHSFWITEDTKVINAEIRALEAQGFTTVACLAENDQQLIKMIRDWKPDVIIEDRHGGSIWDGSNDNILTQIDAPYLRPISLLDSTLEEWQADPHGLGHREEGLFLTLQEPRGTIEPMVIGGLKVNVSGFRLHEPMPERIERFAARAKSWAHLRSCPNKEKRIAIVYYNKSLGKGDIMRGSPTGGFLDGPNSLQKFLPRLREQGYTIDTIPENTAALIDLIRKRGRNIGPWDAGALDQLADHPDATLIPLRQYEEWFHSKLSKRQQDIMIAQYGPPPGKLMVVRRNERPFIVLPVIRLGNIILGPQPARGEKQDVSLLHNRDVPPSHNYLAFYWWLQEDFAAHAVVHWGTHGTIEMMPGKETGLSSEDWGDVCVGTMPMITSWITDNLGEATVARRRSYAVLVDHQVPPAINTGLSPQITLVHDDLHKFYSLADGLLREEFRQRLAQAIHETRIDETLNLDTSETVSDEELKRVEAYLHQLEEEMTPASLHILGQSPNEEILPDYICKILGDDYLERVARISTIPKAIAAFGHQEQWLHERATTLLKRSAFGDAEADPVIADDMVFAKKILKDIRNADVELSEILHALDGGFIRPGPGPDPIRNPASLPTGRNLFALNPEEIPTKPSWDVAVQLIDEMLQTRTPQKIAFDLSGMNTMQDFGVTEGEILYLMGVRPVWDRNQLASDVELIPQAELGRERIDVFIAMGGQYKENFPSRVRLIDKAVRLVSQLDEPQNNVRAASLRVEQALLQHGFSTERAHTLAHARIFGTKPGNLSGTNILYKIPRSGTWENDDELHAIYIDHMSYVYSGDTWGERVDGLYEEAIQGTDTLMRVWSSHMSSQLSNHHAYEYLGGLSMAVRKLTGKEPEALIADVRDPGKARIRSFEEVLASNLRSELLNQKWIAGMREHGYAGAGHMTELVKNTFGWDVTRSSSISDGVWNDIHDIYVNDRYNSELPAWLEQENPHAYQEMLATMLEANRKGYWQADQEIIDQLAKKYAELTVRTEPDGGLVTGGNSALAGFVGERLANNHSDELAKNYTESVKKAEQTADTEKVVGAKLEKQTPDKPDNRDKQEQAQHENPTSDDNTTWLLPLLAALAMLLAIGIWRRAGEPS